MSMAFEMYLSQQVHFFSHNGHCGLNLLAVRSDELIFFILQLLIQHAALLLQTLLFRILAVVQIVLGNVAFSAGCASDGRSGSARPADASSAHLLPQLLQ